MNNHRSLNTTEIITRTDNWLTPIKIIKSLGEFDLDPCSPINRPWDTAKNHFTVEDDGLLLPWEGRVWLNPPYSQLKSWLNKLCLHGDGIAMVLGRTDTNAFHDYVFPHANSIFFFKGRITFYNVTGKLAKSNVGASSVLIAYNEYNSDKIEMSGLKGFHFPLNCPNIIFIERNFTEKTWKVIIGEAMEKLEGEATLNDIYEMVLKVAPGRVSKNKNYKAKVRQTLQFYFNRIDKGIYKN